MKVIDLLNKIANGEEVPEKIKFRGNILDYSDDVDYVDEDGKFLFNNKCCINNEDLNELVEIIGEEKKIPEKLEFGRSIENGKEILTVPSDKMIIIKINEIIDYLKSKGE